jgi:hypothetical protein
MLEAGERRHCLEVTVLRANRKHSESQWTPQYVPYQA